VLTVGVDMGGTFTDGYLAAEDGAFSCKVPTYRFDLTRSLVQCLEAVAARAGLGFGELLERLDSLRVATTVGTNAVVEGTGSRVGLLVAVGQEELLYAGRPPTAVFARYLDPGLVRGVGLPPEGAELLDRCRELVAAGVRQVVVSFPGAATAPEVERQVRQVVRARYPEHYLRSVPLQLASEVSACAEDDVRTATAVVNAYLHRDMAQLLQRAEVQLRADGLRAPLLVVQASAGVAQVAKSTAISTYGSGPAAGLSGAEAVAGAYGDPVVVTADMGGTTLDLGLVLDGRCQTDARPEIGGVRVALPSNASTPVGCGGSSLVTVEDGRVLVGPRSAGAVPGPAAFGRGGERATLTDADLVCGLLQDDAELGGQFALDASRARAAVAEGVAAPLDLPVEEAGARIQEAATARIADAIGALLAAHGLAPERATAYVYGGAGPLHLWAPLARLGIGSARSFPFGSAFSAFGCTVIDVRHHYEAAWDGARPAAPERLGGLLERLVRRGLGDTRAAGPAGQEVHGTVLLLGKDGQVLARVGPLAALERPATLQALVAAALAADGWAEVRSVALDVTVPGPPADPLRGRPAASPGAAGPATRAVWWSGEWRDTPVRAWDDLRPGTPLAGPVLVTERDSTHAVGPGWAVSLDERGNLRWTAR
jgi:N-methylhydantoinase A/oxoprolinase/acetone carboxylase beta subunit